MARGANLLRFLCAVEDTLFYLPATRTDQINNFLKFIWMYLLNFNL